MKRKAIWQLIPLALALVLTLSLAACGGAGGASSSSAQYAVPGAPQESKNTMTDSASEEMYDNGIGTTYGGAENGTADGNGNNLMPRDGRKVIMNANLTIEALDFDATCAALMTALRDAGGYVAATDQYTPSYEGARRSAHYQLRVPAERYENFLEGAGRAGNLVNRNESTQDVTSEYVDVEARLKSLKLQEERLYAMMEQAGELETLLAIQNQLTEVQYQIESYTSRQRTFDDLIAYSTVEVDVQEVRQITERAETFTERVGKAFRQSWTRFGGNVQDFAVGFVEAVPSLLVLAVLAALAIWFVRLLSRRAAARRAARPAPAPYRPAEYGAPMKQEEKAQDGPEPKYKSNP